MSKTEWIRLTPENEDLDESSVTYYRHIGNDAFFPHQLEGGCESIQLTTAEAVAFARLSGVYRDVPEVKALVEAARFTADTLNGVFALSGSRSTEPEAYDLLTRALAPFEEPAK